MIMISKIMDPKSRICPDDRPEIPSLLYRHILVYLENITKMYTCMEARGPRIPGGLIQLEG